MYKSPVLIVEDESIIALDIKEILLEDQHESVLIVSNVDDAILIIENQHPKLVLIDINLHQLKDGVDLGTYLLEKNNIPFIYITSYSDQITVERVNKTRPYGYIIKPFRAEDIKTTVSIVLNNYQHRKIDIAREAVEIRDDVPFILSQSVKYINENITEKINITDLALQTRWKSQHFNRLFFQYIGVTPYQYILDKKMEKAKIIITETTIPITQIAFELGIKSHSNFCSIFKKATGKTPENYRKWHNANYKN